MIGLIAAAVLTSPVQSQPAPTEAPARAGASTRSPSVVILSTLPEAVASARIRAFERLNPGVRAELVVQRPEQILATLRSATPAQRAHLVWSASTEGLTAAAAEGLLLGANGEPQPYGAPAPIDQGVTVRAQHLIRVALARPAWAAAPAWPDRWQDLAQPGDCGIRLANPFVVPGGVGSVLIEAALQDRGWDQGWALLAGLAASSDRAPGGAPQLGFVFEEAVLEAGLELRPAFTAIVRSRLALVAAGSRDMRVAQRFLRFITSDPAAAPVRTVPATTAQYLSLDQALLERREPVLAALARQWLVAQAPNLKQACTALGEVARRADRAGDRALRQALDEARAKAYGPALSEQALGEDTVMQAFSPQLREVLRKPRIAALESQWAALALERHVQAMGLIAATTPSGSAGSGAGTAGRPPGVAPPAPRLTQ